MKSSVPKIVVILVLAATLAWAQPDFSEVEIGTVPVTGNVYMLTGYGGNIGVSVGDDGILIIDDQFAPLAEKIRAALGELSPGELEFVLNTHWHGDHTGGNEIFGETSHIIAHTNVRQRLSTPQEIRGRKIEPKPEHALPVITFDDSLSVHFNGEEIEAVHFEHSHTDGDAVIFFTKSNVVHMGDMFWTARFPFVDLAAGGSVQGLTENIGALIAELPAGVKIIPGHGTLSTLDDVKAFHGMLVETAAIVQKRIDAGMSLEKIQEEGLPEKWDSWGSGYIDTATWLETLHQSLTAVPGTPVGARRGVCGPQALS
jgi:glyoxylase-like metal-dependent hydrolase (beta-lactamase superfamily II)